MKRTVLIISLLLGVHVAAAQSSFQASLVPDVAIVQRGENVRGVALNIWGENEVNGLSLGFVNGLVGESSGLSLSLLGTYAENYTGVIWGSFVAYSTGDVVGWQAGAININRGSFVGFQSGLVNVGNQTKGLQLGLVNYTEELHGVQIGLINIASNNPWFSEFPQKLATGFPFVNWSF